VEDLFFIADANDQPLRDPQTIEKFQKALQLELEA
jgi:hypothetical protein